MSTPLNGSILKAFEVLGLVSRDRPEVTAALVEAELGMNFATAHRFLTTLEEAGALVAVRRGVYRLGLVTADLGRLAEETNPYAPKVQPLIAALCAELNESVMICRLGRSGPTCVAVALADRPITVSIRVGTVLNALTSAQGRLWLAEMDAKALDAFLTQDSARIDRPGLIRDLEDIRSQGHARNSGMAEPDIAAIAAPVRNARGGLFLTVSVFGPLNRFTPAFQTLAEAKVKDVARRIEALLRP